MKKKLILTLQIWTCVDACLYIWVYKLAAHLDSFSFFSFSGSQFLPASFFFFLASAVFVSAIEEGRG